MSSFSITNTFHFVPKDTSFKNTKKHFPIELFPKTNIFYFKLHFFSLLCFMACFFLDMYQMNSKSMSLAYNPATKWVNSIF